MTYEEIKHETDRAMLYVIDGVEHWIPKSQIIDDDGDMVAIPTWLAKSKGFE